MECNRDEAIRAKEIAERKFLSKDYNGAKKFALKAQSLFPELEGISQIVSTFDVYISAENKIYDESDWYGILSVSPQADDETVRKQYRKMALILHPDKNKSVGAEGAFKYISQAWNFLSDKDKRQNYDYKRQTKTYAKVSKPPSSQKTSTSDYYNFSNNSSANVKNHKSTSNQRSKPTTPPPVTPFPKPPPAAPSRKQQQPPMGSSHKPPPPPRGDAAPSREPSTPAGSSHKPQPPRKPGQTFWTVCHRCRMQYEYLRVYLNHNLLCPNCREPFLAIETSPPPKKATQWNFNQEEMKSNLAANKRAASSGKNNIDGSSSSFQWRAFSKTGTPSQTASMVQQTYERVRREREEAQAATRRKMQASKRSGDVSSSSNAAKRRRGSEDIRNNVPGYNAGSSSDVPGSNKGSFGISTKPDSSNELNKPDFRNLLIKKAKHAISKKIPELNSATENDKRQPLVNDEGYYQNKFNYILHCSIKRSETLDTASIDVPDPEFSDFNKDRSESSFCENQVWAAYDDHNAMPRYYAIVHHIISLNPLKMFISWLKSETNSDFGGFSKSCGEFRVGRSEIYTKLDSFSHKINWAKGSEKGVICIYPRKGETWALYRNWSPEWNEFTPNDVMDKYDIVEVLEYSEDLGILVIPLVKVAGFKTVFHYHLDWSQVKRIPKEEILRFSHQVPSKLLTGEESSGTLKGFLELDPAATPLDLFESTVDVVTENGIVENGEKAEDSVEKAEDNGEKVRQESWDALNAIICILGYLFCNCESGSNQYYVKAPCSQGGEV